LSIIWSIEHQLKCNIFDESDLMAKRVSYEINSSLEEALNKEILLKIRKSLLNNEEVIYNNVSNPF